MKDLLITDFTNLDFQQAFKLYFDELGVNVKHWDELFAEMNQDKDNIAYIRFSEANEIIGFIQFIPITLTNWFFESHMGFIREFWIAKEYRGKGNGSDLLRLAETYFKDNGILKSILTTDTAPLFYQKNGYTRDVSIVAKNQDDIYIKELK